MKLKCYGRRQKQDVNSLLRKIPDNTDSNETDKAPDLLVDLCRSYLNILSIYGLLFIFVIGCGIFE